MRRYVFALVLLLLTAGGALAQDAAINIDYDLWDRTAVRAEEAVDAGRASDIALESLRRQLTNWREDFSQARDANATRIDSLNAQLSVLGEATEGEPDEIIARREELSRALAEARAPGQTAEVAYNRADGLIQQIDKIIRGRETDALLSLGPSPLNPVNWIGAFNAVTSSFTALIDEFKQAWNSPIQQAETKKVLPVSIILFLIGAVLIFRGRAWSLRLSRYLLGRDKIAWRWMTGFCASLGQFILPTLGITIVVEAIYSTGLAGLRGDVILSALPLAGFIFYFSRWIGGRLFPQIDDEHAYFNLSDGQRAEGRYISVIMGAALAFHVLVGRLINYDAYPAIVSVVLIFPLMVISAIMLVRFGQLLLAHARNEERDQELSSYHTKALRWLGRGVLLAAVVGVGVAVVGYFNAGEKLVFPAAKTLGLLGFLLVLHRLLEETYMIISKRGEDARDALVPVLLGIVLLLASIPLLALIWGARVATLEEAWTKFRSGIAIGDVEISPIAFMTFAVIFAVGYMLTRLFQGALRTSILPKTKLDAGGRNAIVSGTGYVGIFLAALIGITGAGINLSSLAIVAGALSVGIGFGLQNIVSNFVSGIILLIERPISEGDWIEVSGKSGYVRDISVRSTRIETFDRADVIVPNADLISGVVMNMTKGSLIGRVIVPVGVAYGTDTKHVETILREIAEAHPMVVLSPAPGVVFQGFGADSMDFEIRAVIRDVNWGLTVRSEMNHEIARRFGEEGIEIPFAQREVRIKNPEALSAAPKPAPKPKAKPTTRRKKKDATEDVDLGLPGDSEGEAR